MIKFLPVLLIAGALLAGCGSTNSSPPTPTPTLAPLPTATPLVTGSIAVGTGRSGGSILGAVHLLNKPKQLYWLATLSTPVSGQVELTITRTNGPVPHPNTVWTDFINVPSVTDILSGHMTSAQMTSRQIVAGGAYLIKYTKSGSTLASKEFALATASGGSPGGY